MEGGVARSQTRTAHERRWECEGREKKGIIKWRGLLAGPRVRNSVVKLSCVNIGLLQKAQHLVERTKESSRF